MRHAGEFLIVASMPTDTEDATTMAGLAPVLVTRRESFSAAHRLWNPSLTETRNLEVYGRCSNPAGHGHNYVLEVSVLGTVDPDTGFVFDLKRLAGVVHDEIIAEVDHRNLNSDVEWLCGCVPTTEVLAAVFWARLEAAVAPSVLFSVRVQETEKNTAECSLPVMEHSESMNSDWRKVEISHR
jgi:6-pyruvoyltetrahydropterin/6-carboxytetrahydropterin synthase